MYEQKAEWIAAAEAYERVERVLERWQMVGDRKNERVDA